MNRLLLWAALVTALAACQPIDVPLPSASGTAPTSQPDRAKPVAATQPAVVVAPPATPIAVSRPDAASVDGLPPAGVPEGVTPEFTMPGRGALPVAGDPAMRRRSGMQAALAIAIYNVTKEISGAGLRDEIERGYIASDHFRYQDDGKGGLEVKSQTTVVDGKVKQFDVWLLVPAGAKAGEGRFQMHVRNFTLVGEPESASRIARVLSSSGRHLVLVGSTGADEQGFCSAEVGLVRNPTR